MKSSDFVTNWLAMLTAARASWSDGQPLPLDWTGRRVGGLQPGGSARRSIWAPKGGPDQL